MANTNQISYKQEDLIDIGGFSKVFSGRFACGMFTPLVVLSSLTLVVGITESIYILLSCGLGVFWIVWSLRWLRLTEGVAVRHRRFIVVVVVDLYTFVAQFYFYVAIFAMTTIKGVSCPLLCSINYGKIWNRINLWQWQWHTDFFSSVSVFLIIHFYFVVVCVGSYEKFPPATSFFMSSV